jgi:N-acetylglucosaminyl-diphospho-decaprenol L-rhamnosyltransferase
MDECREPYTRAVDGSSQAGPGGLGVVVLTHGEGGGHVALLEELLMAGVPAGAVVLVHNPTAPGQLPPPAPEGVRVLQSPRNLGYAAGMNLGIGAQLERDVELLLALTHDARFRGGGLEALLAAARANPEFGVLAPVLVLARTGEPFSYGGVTGARGATEHLKAEPPATADGIAECDWADGGTLLLRAAALRRVGLFDERFWGYCEESDLCLRMRRAGLRVGVVLDAVAEQEPGGPARPGVWAYLLTRNGAEYARRVAGARGALAAEARAARTVALSLLRVLARAIRRRPGGPREPWLLAVGTARGALDFLRGRWGPPPSSLPGMGDVRNV